MASSASTKSIFPSPLFSSSSSSSSKSRSSKIPNLSFLSSNTFGTKPNDINIIKLSCQQRCFVVNSVLKTVDQTKQTISNNVVVGNEKPTILVSEKLGEAGLQVLRKLGNVVCAYDLSPEELCTKISTCDALIVRSGTKVTRKVFEAGKGKLRVVGRAGVGIDNVDLQAATEFGCLVVNAPTANTIAAAEHGIALLAAMARNVSQADASLKAGKWLRSKYVGVSMVGKTLAVMGFGKVGSEVARRAKGLGMNVIAHDPYAPADRARAAAFAKMKKGVRIINVARGGVIDEDALVKALDSGIVAQAALDVFTEEPPAKDSKLVQHENVIATPHLGASTKEAQEGVAIEIAEAVVGALNGELSATAVNAPMVAPEVLSELAPYVALAEKLGRLAVQLVSGGSGIQSIKVVYRSARGPDNLDTRLLRAMIIKGVIEPISNTIVNLVNADYIAKQRGLRISEEKVAVDSSLELPVESIQIQISNVESKFASAVSEGQISIDGKVKQIDQPGMIGLVGNILGQQNVNVSFMSVGRTSRRQKAIMAIGVDEEPNKEALENIGAVPAVEEFVFLKL
ncbi:unnamed protein product [Vicia faba]|uniref:phosphoglycerate dehydrogenase n=1 Tax=Vicia faba TaxID=3906 RepID=A0AAV0ZX73_VICFA|nr:unnamed protein product [Vicia faba]